MAQRVVHRRALPSGTREIHAGAVRAKPDVQIEHDVFVDTTDATFTGHDLVVDCEAECDVLVKITLTDFTLDGETAGVTAGTIHVDTDDPTVSSDGASYSAASTAGGAADGNMTTVDDSITYFVRTDKFVKVPAIQIVTNTGAVYSGTNDPAATVQIDVYKLGVL